MGKSVYDQFEQILYNHFLFDYILGVEMNRENHLSKYNHQINFPKHAQLPVLLKLHK